MIKRDNQISEDVAVIQKHTHNCKTIVESLLNFARVSEPSFKKTELHPCLDDILSVLQSEITKQNISINKKFIPDTIYEMMFKLSYGFDFFLMFKSF